jgi:hypothetical protein
MASRAVLAGVALALCASSAAAAQDAAQPAPAPAPGAAADAKQIETYRREVFRYQRAGRPDPFQPLLTTADLGYRVEDLRLTSIVYSPDPQMSIAVFAAADGSARFRLRRGQRLGGITVAAILPRRVDLQVNEFGSVRTQSVTLQRAGAEMAPGPGAGAAGAQGAAQPQGQPGAPQPIIIQQPPAAPAPPPGPLRRGGSQPAAGAQAAPAQAPAQSQPQASSPNPRRTTGQAAPRNR